MFNSQRRNTEEKRREENRVGKVLLIGSVMNKEEAKRVKAREKKKKEKGDS